MKKQYVEEVVAWQHFDIDGFHQGQSMLKNNSFLSIFFFRVITFA
jgi:hypothetical protein